MAKNNETHEIELDEEELQNIIATHLHRKGYDVPEPDEIEIGVFGHDVLARVKADFRWAWALSKAKEKKLREQRKKIVEKYLDDQTHDGWEQMLLEINEMNCLLGGVHVKVKLEDGFLNIMPSGYGELDAIDGTGAPISIEIYRSELRVILRPDINKDDPKIIFLEGARESNRKTP